LALDGSEWSLRLLNVEIKVNPKLGTQYNTLNPVILDIFVSFYSNS
jgi:hypothetical protein